MPELDLTRFRGLPWRLYDPERLECTRYAFAAAVCDFAATCRSNRELLDGIFVASSPENGLPWPTVLGEGSTRRAWSLPFGLALKLERTDDLSETEMSTRGTKNYLYSIPGINPWEPCRPLSPQHRAQTIELSKSVFSLYQLAYAQSLLSAPEILQAA